MKTGVIDVGGGLRGIYAVGIFDYFMERGIRFDLGIGVSAGSANLASFTSNQKGRNYKFYTEFAFRPRYLSVRNFIFRGSVFDLDYVYGTLSDSDGEYPLDYPALRDNPMEFYVVATDGLTGRAKYFDKSDIKQDCYDVFKASSAIPFFCKPYVIGGVPYFDGALGDPVPVKKAFELGCDRVVLILTKPEAEIRTSKSDERVAARIRKKYPEAAESLCKRAERYNAGVALAEEYAKSGRALILSPDDTCGVDTMKRDKPSLLRLYEKGYRDARRAEDFLRGDL